MQESYGPMPSGSEASLTSIKLLSGKDGYPQCQFQMRILPGTQKPMVCICRVRSGRQRTFSREEE